MRRLVLLLAAGSALLPAAARAAPPLTVSFEKYKLPNGLTVILVPDRRQPTVVVDLWFRVGSKDERAGRSGFAHLFEHLMFMGTKGVPGGQFDQIMEAHGGTNNATTSEDRTNYFESGPAHLLETFLFLEADRLGSLDAAMTKAKVDLQRDVVKNERRQSYENRPYGKVELVLPERMFPADHPYHHPVIGSHEDLTAASVDDVKDFFRSYYVANNAALVIGGDFVPAQARKLVAKYFARLPRRPEPPHAAPAPARLEKPETVELRDQVQLDQVVLAWHSPGAFLPGDSEADLLSVILGHGRSSRLHLALVEKRRLAESVQVEQRTMRYGSLFVITATALPGHRADEIELAISEELAALLGHRPATAAELERARAYIQTLLLSRLEQPFELADTVNAYEFQFGDPGELPKRALARYDEVDLPRLAATAKTILSAPRLSIRVRPAPATQGAAK